MKPTNGTTILLTLISAVAVIAGACRPRPSGTLEVIEISKRMGGLDDRADPFVIVDRNVLSFSDTRWIATQLARPEAVVDLTISDFLPREKVEIRSVVWLFGVHARDASTLARDATVYLVLPSGKPPFWRASAVRRVVLGAPGGALGDFADWRRWCESKKVPFVVARENTREGIRDAIVLVASQTAEYEDKAH